jgi:hypothetical protein
VCLSRARAPVDVRRGHEDDDEEDEAPDAFGINVEIDEVTPGESYRIGIARYSSDGQGGYEFEAWTDEPRLFLTVTSGGTCEGDHAGCDAGAGEESPYPCSGVDCTLAYDCYGLGGCIKINSRCFHPGGSEAACGCYDMGLDPCMTYPTFPGSVIYNWLSCIWETKQGYFPDDLCIVEVFRYEDQ